jgi:hypothetical protein
VQSDLTTPLCQASATLRAEARALTRLSRDAVANRRRLAGQRAAAVRKNHRPSTSVYFSSAGLPRAWDPVRRELQLGDRTLYVAADVGTMRLQVGAQILVAGYLLVTPSILGVVTRLVVR